MSEGWAVEITDEGELFVVCSRHRIFIADCEGACSECFRIAHLFAALAPFQEADDGTAVDSVP